MLHVEIATVWLSVFAGVVVEIHPTFPTGHSSVLQQIAGFPCKCAWLHLKLSVDFKVCMGKLMSMDHQDLKICPIFSSRPFGEASLC